MPRFLSVLLLVSFVISSSSTSFEKLLPPGHPDVDYSGITVLLNNRDSEPWTLNSMASTNANQDTIFPSPLSGASGGFAAATFIRYPWDLSINLTDAQGLNFAFRWSQKEFGGPLFTAQTGQKSFNNSYTVLSQYPAGANEMYLLFLFDYPQQ